MTQKRLTQEELRRYSRHLALPGFDETHQIRLIHSSILVVGCGALGHPVAAYLAAAGIGTIGLADFDTIELSNLQRQVLFSHADIGRKKSAVLGERLAAFNPAVTLNYHSKITSANVMDEISGYDLVIDCTDNFPTRYLLNDACAFSNKPLIYGAIYRYEGQVSVFNYKSLINYRDLFPVPPSPGSVPDCATGGVLGSLAGITGSMQASEAIKLLTGIGELLDGRLWIFNALDATTEIIKLAKRSDNPLNSGQYSSDSLKNIADFCAPQTPGTRDMKVITVEEFRELIDSSEDFQLIDVREPYEKEEADIGGELIPMNSIPEHIGEIARDKKVIVYCRSGVRSGNVVNYLEQKGIENAYNLEGGIMKWLRTYKN